MAGALTKTAILKDSNATEGGTSALEEQFPWLEGLRKSLLLGAAPDEVATGSVLDPRATKRNASMRAGAEVGFPINTALQVIPGLAPILKWAGGGGKAAEAISKYMQATGMELNAMPGGKKAMARAAVEDLKIPGFTPDELQGAVRRDDFITKFGSKADREAALAKRVQSQAEDAAIQDAADLAVGAGAVSPARAVRARQSGPAVAPDYYRQLEADKGQGAVLSAVRAGKHLKPDGAGGYIGAPRTVDSPQGLGALRRGIDSQFDDGVEAIAYSDPDRLGTWYDRAKEGIAASAEPHQLDRVLDQHAVYSAGVSPESELGFALKHLNSRANGDPTMAYRGAGMRNLDSAEAAGVPTPLAFKVGEYRAKNDPRLPNTGLFGVNDFRAAQGFGYTTPDGAIWKGGVSDTMHPFMDAETALAVDRANAAGVGGRTDWQGPHLQEVPWVYGKAQDLYTRGSAPKARFGGENGRELAVQEANNTARDYMYKHAGSATYESVPGASTGHVPSILDASPAAKKVYSEVGPWAVDSPYTLGEAPTVGAGKRDAIYSAIGYRQLPSVESAGAYRNSRGVVEHNPMTIARPLLDFPTGGVGLVDDGTQNVLSAAERFRAAMDAQEAGAWNLPNSMASTAQKNGLVLDSRAAGDTLTGAQPSAEQLMAVNDVLDKAGFSSRLGATASNRGMHVFPYNGTDGVTQTAMRELKKIYPELQKAFPSEISPALSNTGYVPGIGKWGKGSVDPTAPFSGEATAGVLEDFAKLHPNVTQNISESEAVRNAIRAKTGRDADLPGAREDIQNMRKFFSEADWAKAVDLIRKGMTPAAALAAMGYSLNSMASPVPEGGANP